MAQRTRIPFDALMKVHTGPFGVVRVCSLCGEIVHRRPVIRGAGRGAGMREGNKGNGLMVTHWKSCHADSYTTLLTGKPI